MGYYLDQASQFVTVTNNVAYDIKCAGFLQNFGLNCTISNNVLAFVNENLFWPGADFSGQTCAGNCGSAVYAASNAVDPIGPGSGLSAFNFTRNIVYWRQGPLLGGGSSVLSSSYSQNLYWNADDRNASFRADGFPCPESFGPLNPTKADGVMYDGQRMVAGQVLLSHGKTAWASLVGESFCVGQGTQPRQHTVWCSPPQPGNLTSITMQGDGNLCVEAGAQNHWCASSCSKDGCPAPGSLSYYGVILDNCTYCVYSGPYPHGEQTWCTPGSCSSVHGVASGGEGVAVGSGAAPTGCSFATWQRKGYDHGTVIADPMFVAPEARDFRLKPGSPALALGIRSLDVSGVGPRPLTTLAPPPPAPPPSSLLPPGPRLRDLAAARNPPLFFGTDFFDAFPYPATGDPADCVDGNMSAPGCSPNASFAAIAANEFNAGNSDSCLVWAASQPTPNNSYDFSCADRIFSFMAQHNMTYAHVNAVMQVSNCR